jgi:UDP-N-acetylglucosamine 2-epimerase (non-hydrolysing)
MKVMTVVGTRPEVIRLSRVIEKLDAAADHVLVHTGQNYDPRLSEIFFEQLGVRRPDHFLGIRGDTFGAQIGRMIEAVERLLIAERPDRVLILGDTNSGLTAIVAKRLGIAVYHMEAGNRCYDDRVPEEINRRVIDQCSDVLMPYTERSRANLLREGIAGERIYVTGNPILEVIEHHAAHIERSSILDRLGLDEGRYFLVTMHREENVDVESRLRSLIDALRALHRQYRLPIVCSLHPRTADRIRRFAVDLGDEISFHQPFGFFDFVALEQRAACVVTDSGTVQEECCIFKVRNVTIRDVTERPETLECGSNILAGADADAIVRAVAIVLDRGTDWHAPAEYLVRNVSRTIINIVLGYTRAVAARPIASSAPAAEVVDSGPGRR